MSANHYRPHVLILPEDDANRDIVVGFRQHPGMDFRQVQVEDVAGGWREVLDRFETEYVAELLRRPNRYMVMLIDLDGNIERVEEARGKVPAGLENRVYVFGVLTEPERLKSDLHKSYEEIGIDLARDCQDGTDESWGIGFCGTTQPR